VLLSCLLNFECALVQFDLLLVFGDLDLVKTQLLLEVLPVDFLLRLDLDAVQLHFSLLLDFVLLELDLFSRRKYF